MMGLAADVLMVLYFVVLLGLAIFGIHRYILLFLFMRHKGRQPRPKKFFRKLPRVTIQLPLYNEQYVVERLLDSVSRIEYPRELLDIQVLDDSTDDTIDIAAGKVAELRASGLDITYIHRTDRSGFKAGALTEGLKTAKGQLVLIFDADFLPRPDILKESVHFFTDPEVGLVQMRWGHVNRGYSLLTEIQSILLDGHFIVEHTARSRTGRFFNFNGTAGIWRRRCIADAGGWDGNTLTEDLDLSYRAQLKGWQFVYLHDVISPAELPVNMNAFKTQQHRWAKGATQTGKKMLPVVWKSRIPLKAKIEATFHLTNNLAYPLVVMLALLMGPVLTIRATHFDESRLLWMWDVPVFVAASLSVILFYVFSQRFIYRGWLVRMRFIPMLLSLGVGLSLNNAKAVIEAILGHESKFVRTPKFNICTHSDSWQNKQYATRTDLVPYAEMALGAYITIYMILTIIEKNYMAVPFFLLFQVGFFYVGISSLIENHKARGGNRPAATD